MKKIFKKKNNPSIYNKLLNNINDGLKQKELENQNLKIKKQKEILILMLIIL